MFNSYVKVKNRLYFIILSFLLIFLFHNENTILLKILISFHIYITYILIILLFLTSVFLYSKFLIFFFLGFTIIYWNQTAYIYLYTYLQNYIFFEKIYLDVFNAIFNYSTFFWLF